MFYCYFMETALSAGTSAALLSHCHCVLCMKMVVVVMVMMMHRCADQLWTAWHSEAELVHGEEAATSRHLGAVWYDISLVIQPLVFGPLPRCPLLSAQTSRPHLPLLCSQPMTTHNAPVTDTSTKPAAWFWKLPELNLRKFLEEMRLLKSEVAGLRRTYDDLKRSSVPGRSYWEIVEYHSLFC